MNANMTMEIALNTVLMKRGVFDVVVRLDFYSTRLGETVKVKLLRYLGSISEKGVSKFSYV